MAPVATFVILSLLSLPTSVTSASTPSQSEISGTWSGVLLPIGEGDAIDWRRTEDEIDALLGSGVSGIYTAGTAEELWTLSDWEFSKLGRLVESKARVAGLPFQIGASHPSPQVMRQRVAMAKQWSPAAIQVILPDYYPVTDAEAEAFVRDISQLAAPIGIVLYNPGNAKRVLTPEQLAPLSRYVVGLKVVDKDRSWFSAMKRCCGNVSIAVTGHHFASSYAFGMTTSYSNVAALSPCGASRWFKDLIEPGRRDPGRLAASLELEDRIGDFFQEAVIPFAARGYSDMALDKLLAEIGGWADVGTRLRQPYAFVPIEEARAWRAEARRRLPELFDCQPGAASPLLV